MARKRLSYGNVMSTALVFLALAGGTALAAHQLAKNSVGKKQLKSNAVTTAKIKKNAVTTAKIKDSAINSAKIADSSVTGTDINAATTPFQRIVHEARGASTISVPPTETLVNYPLENASYTQEAESDDRYIGALEFTIPSTCTGERDVFGVIFVDPVNPAEPQIGSQEVAAIGVYEDEGSGTVHRRMNLGPYLGNSFRHSTATNHTLQLAVSSECESGSGVTASFGAIDAIGVK